MDICVVGNGPVSRRAASLIDTAGMVVRFNGCRSFGQSGSRTDVIAVCNVGNPARAMLADNRWRTHKAVTDARSIWAVCDPIKYALLAPRSLEVQSELGDVSDDFTEDFRKFCIESNKEFYFVGPDAHDAADRMLAAYVSEPYVAPSSGLIIVTHLMSRYPLGKIAVSGFSHQGWSAHPFEAERQLFEDLVGRGRIERL